MSERLARVRENIKETVGMLLERRIKDPRIGLVTVTGVDVSPDLRHCKIFFSTMGGKKRREKAMDGLESARGFIRGELGKTLQMKYTPEVEFVFDDSVEKGARIAEILNKLKTPGEENG